MTADTTNMRASTEERIDAFAKIFGKETEAASLKKEIDDAFAAAKAAAAGKGNGLVVLVNGGKMSAFGPDSRFGWIHRDVGVPPVDENIKIVPSGWAFLSVSKTATILTSALASRSVFKY